MRPVHRYQGRDREAGPRIRRALAILLLIGQAGIAQTFDSGSDGSDGALDLTEPGEILFDPQSFSPPLDPDGDNVYHFTTINIASGVTVRMTSTRLRHSPVFWLASGGVTIDGSLILDGEAGHPGTSVPADRRPSEPGPGGFAGGVGGFAGGGPPQPGSGPGGGASGLSDPNFRRGAGGSFSGNTFLVPLFGGSGGGGGGTGGSTGPGGGAGGGAILIVSSVSIEVQGTIRSNGGAGTGFGQNACCNHAGGGSGGAIRLVAPVVSGSGRLEAVRGRANRSGGAGRIRLEAFQQNFGGSTDPTPIRASPFGLFLDSARPSVRVVSVAGVPVPPTPTASFEMPDVTIMDGGTVTFEIEAENVPPGTVVSLHLFSENGLDQTVDSSPLTGTEELSTASATVDLPPGFSRSFVRLTFEPGP